MLRSDHPDRRCYSRGPHPWETPSQVEALSNLVGLWGLSLSFNVDRDGPGKCSDLTILIVAVILGALIRGKRLPKSKLYLIWLVFGVYLYLSMWIGTALGNAPI